MRAISNVAGKANVTSLRISTRRFWDFSLTAVNSKNLSPDHVDHSVARSYIESCRQRQAGDASCVDSVGSLSAYPRLPELWCGARCPTPRRTVTVSVDFGKWSDVMRFTLAGKIVLVLGASGVLAPVVGQDAPNWPMQNQTIYQAPRTNYQTSESSAFAPLTRRADRGTFQAGLLRAAEPSIGAQANPYSPVITSAPRTIGSGPIKFQHDGGSVYPQQYQPHGAACGCSSCAFPGGVVQRTSKWFAGVYGLVMTRDSENKLWLSYDTDDIRNRVLTSRDAESSYAGGFETRVGRYFHCGQKAIEFVYWGVFPGDAEGMATAADVNLDLDTILHFDGISYDPGFLPVLVGTAFFQADRHRVQRSYQFHNVEVNLLGMNFVPCGGKGCGGKGCDLLSPTFYGQCFSFS